MNNINYVLVYDSGVGGLTTLKECQKLNPRSNLLYFSDNKNCPYGTKTQAELLSIIKDNIAGIMTSYNISAIVLACNTATTACIKELRGYFHIPIVGTEPNISSPTKQGFKHITVLATPLTLKQERVQFLEKNSTAKIHHLSMKNLASLIEEYELTRNKEIKIKIIKYLKQKLKYTPKAHAIVLGCTHYIFFKSFLENNLGFTCFDGNLGVAKRLHEVLKCIDFSPSHTRLKFLAPTLSHTLKLKRAFLRLK